MTEAASGGLPWGFAAAGFGAMAAALGALWRWATVRLAKSLEALEACERRGDALDKEHKEFLLTLLDQKHAARRGGVYRSKEAPPGIKRKERTTRELALEAAEFLTAEGLDMTGTMH